MTTPADFAALRALVEALDGSHKRHWYYHGCVPACALLPAAREALEQLARPSPLRQAIEAARQKWYQDHGGRDTVQELCERQEARIAQLVDSLIETRRHGTATDPCWCAYRVTETRPHRAWCVAALAALEGYHND